MNSKGDKRNGKREAIALVARVQVILRRWDPIGIQPGVDWPADEYDGYAHHIVSMVATGASHSEVAEHLGALSVDITGNTPIRERDERFATEIINAVRE